VRKAEAAPVLVDGKGVAGFIAGRRDQGRYEDIRVDDARTFFFSRLYALISASISCGVSLSRPRSLALAQAFSSHLGGGGYGL